VSGLVDLTMMGWPDLEITDGGLEIAATCTLTDLLRFEPPSDWRAFPLVSQCVNSLVASFKIHRVATVGGNLCTALPAGSIIALTAGLDAQAVIWCPDGSAREMPVVDFVLGVRRTALLPGEVLRAVRIGRPALESRTAYRKIALTALGRSGSLVVGRAGDDGTAITVTGATERPYQFRYAAIPEAEALSLDLDTIEPWYDDPHGSPRWRAHVTRLLAEEIRHELSQEEDR
jgi:CO/xanthine dehydrogenase FAD-binding subunit